MLLLLMAALLASSLAFPAFFLAPALVSSLLFMWSRENPTARVSFFGIFTVDGARVKQCERCRFGSLSLLSPPPSIS